MKKVLTILVVLTLIAGAAFADAPVAPAGNKITLTTAIDPVKPSFKMSIKTGENTFSDATTYSVTKKLTEGVSEVFMIEQVGAARLAKGTAPVLTITCGSFYLYNGETKDETKATALPEVTVTSTTNNRDNLAVTGTATDNIVTITPTYTGNVVAGEIARFSASWTADDTLPAGTYKADVQLAYTAL